jgi:Protein of unknown function (DUF3619)
VNKFRNNAAMADPALVEARLGTRLAGALSLASQTLPPGVDERLRVAREQAVARAAARQDAVVVGVGGGGAALLGRMASWWPRFGAMLPAVVLAVGALTLADLKEREDVSVAVEIDTALLADDLPPEAYADPGFVAFLKLRQP